MLLTTLKTAVLAPIPMARVRMTVAAKPGDFPNRRNTSFKSVPSDSSQGSCHTSRLRSSSTVAFPKARRAACSASFRLMPSRHKLLCLFLQVKTHLLSEIAIECLATEDTR